MTAQPPDESLLVAQIAQRDRKALNQLYDRYASILYSFAFKILASAEETEEVVLDVFSQVWKQAHNYSPQKGRVDTWLFVLTRSRSLDRLRTLQRTTRAMQVSLDAAKTQQSRSNEPIETAIIQERRQQVLSALDQIPQEQQQAIELAYYKGLSCSAIATLTHTPLGTIKTRIRLGLKKLRQILNAVQ